MMMTWTPDTALTTTELYQIGVLTPWLFSTNNVTETLTTLVIKSNGLEVFTTFMLVYKRSAFVSEFHQFIAHLQSRFVIMMINMEQNSSQINLNLTNKIMKNCSVNCEIIANIELTPRNIQEKLRVANVSVNGFSVDVYSQTLVIHATFSGSRLVINEVIQGKDVIISCVTLSTVLTNACFAVSVVALIVLIVVQRKLCLIDNIPSSNIENISISLSLSNFIFIAGSAALEIRSLCYVIGITLHYLWLTVFTFMTISVIWISTTLTRIRGRKMINSGTSKRKVMLTLMGLAIPIVCVGPAVIVDVFGPPGWSPGYADKVCFPNRYPANLVFFTGPIVIALTINLFCLIYIIGRVCAVRQEAANIRKLSPYKDAILYLRIVVISGVFWFTGIIAALYDTEWINFVFTLFCVLHGCFLSIGILTSSRVKFNFRRKESTAFTN